ncbi:GGDEF domain-containing protein [Psychromonas sp. Urea-02u-13]|uniref:GGDEF domain-containing protein n=1 Tax=Psychromonas sp. Urea-02u-13 TaxID=2058326 RepID=UPI000C31C866|nr:GGDEF domain-containing protein [Psychromonas sp. Urea-02u-13]PKG38089.1 hypothetical protein CXF74_15495 [Psychromonas sp. Urea-02u-13]
MSLQNKNMIFDIILIAVINIGFIFISINLDMFERFYHYSREYEFMQLDELFPLTFTLLISLVYFVLRRWRDSIYFSQMAEQKASKDSLTKLLNRRTLERTLATEWDRLLRYNEDFCVVLFDLDDFSAINENLGYVEGDRVLIEAATMLLNTTRKTDFCARWGEEEFLILCPVCKNDQAAILAEKLRSSLYRTLKDGVELSASFAVAQSDKTTSLEELMKRVDFALHKAKKRGKNCVVKG